MQTPASAFSKNASLLTEETIAVLKATYGVELKEPCRAQDMSSALSTERVRKIPVQVDYQDTCIHQVNKRNIMNKELVKNT